MSKHTALPILESCDGCGACCMTQESPPGYLSILVYGEDDHDPEDVARFRALPVEALQELRDYRKLLAAGTPHPNNDICLWFDETTQQCKHYDLRPSVCRNDVIINDEACRFWRSQFKDTVKQ